MHSGADNEYSSAKKHVLQAFECLSYYPWRTLCLGVLSTILLLAAVVLGVSCVKASEGLSIQNVNVSELYRQLQQLQAKHSEVIRDQEKAQKELANKVTNHETLKHHLDMQKTINDGLQDQIMELRVERGRLQVNVSDNHNSCGRCPSGWTLFGSSCYFYSDSLTKKTWHEGREDCISRGADLVVIDTWEEQELLFESLPQVNPSSQPWWATNDGIWIGLSDMQNEDVWVWVNNVTLDSGYWMNGEPNDYKHGNEGEDCVAMFNRGSPRKTWFDARCGKHSYNWLCEMIPSVF